MDDVRTPLTSFAAENEDAVATMTEFYQWHGVTNSVHTGRFGLGEIQPFLTLEDAVAAALRLRGAVFLFPEGADIGELVE